MTGCKGPVAQTISHERQLTNRKSRVYSSSAEEVQPVCAVQVLTIRNEHDVVQAEYDCSACAQL
ncbi:hypothetical protein FEM33_17100 [Dyadobacter flavalbus]|uniref:Uncharacterized protein n=1 Tax=Dyadobacter flavalbus TaxID=2579942 RepID=A0A5M8QUU1_9BACT|nr:hypothetical protein [Dyadobacter flavalbus]KAA6438406.1 hypothetical protein FEM33_17100 [Dyadobacter flavalbus]